MRWVDAGFALCGIEGAAKIDTPATTCIGETA